MQVFAFTLTHPVWIIQLFTIVRVMLFSVESCDWIVANIILDLSIIIVRISLEFNASCGFLGYVSNT